jgi:hypothetical protein
MGGVAGINVKIHCRLSKWKLSTSNARESWIGPRLKSMNYEIHTWSFVVSSMDAWESLSLISRKSRSLHGEVFRKGKCLSMWFIKHFFSWTEHKKVFTVAPWFWYAFAWPLLNLTTVRNKSKRVDSQRRLQIKKVGGGWGVTVTV